jgi:F0F1-type ATP synthase gamma subunit
LNNQNPLLVKKESYRLWFEFYKLATQSKKYEVIKALTASRDYYKSWGDVSEINFDNWWKSHSKLFEQFSVKLLSNFSDRQLKDSLIIEVPLNESSSVLIQKVKEIIEGQRSKNLLKKRVEKQLFGNFQLTKHSEPKLKTLREVLNIYRDVYLKSDNTKGIKFYNSVINYYQSRPKNKRIPPALDPNGNPETTAKNLRRWMQWAKQIELNVAKGEFPGEY